MWQEDDEESFDDKPERFILCAIHQAKILRERWKYWSGSVPSHVSVRLHRLESILSFNVEARQRHDIQDNDELLKTNHKLNNSFDTSEIPLKSLSEVSSSQPFLVENRNTSAIDKYLNERIEPKHNIIIQGPDIPQIVKQKRRVHFFCCH